MDDNKTPIQPQTEKDLVPDASVSVDSDQKHPQKSGFTPLGQLLKDTWHLMTKKLLKMIVLMLYVMLAIFAVVAVFGIIAMVVIFALGSGGGLKEFTASPGAFGLYMILFGLYIVVVTVISSVQQISSFLILNEPDEEASVMSIIKKSFPFILPLILVTILSTIIIFGAMFALVIPGIIISIMLSFILYVVVLEKKRGMSALKMSMGIVQQSFGAIIGRILAILGIIIGIIVVMAILSEISDTLAAVMGLVQLILQLGLGIFMTSYIFLIYKQARASYDESKPVSMAWVWIVSAIGWVLAVLFMGGMMSLAATLPSNFMEKALEQNMKNQPNDMMYDGSTDFDIETNGDMPDEFNQMFDEEFQKQLQEQMQKEAGNEI